MESGKPVFAAFDEQVWLRDRSVYLTTIRKPHLHWLWLWHEKDGVFPDWKCSFEASLSTGHRSGIWGSNPQWIEAQQLSPAAPIHCTSTAVHKGTELQLQQPQPKNKTGLRSMSSIVFAQKGVIKFEYIIFTSTSYTSHWICCFSLECECVCVDFHMFVSKQYEAQFECVYIRMYACIYIYLFIYYYQLKLLLIIIITIMIILIYIYLQPIVNW